MYQYCLSQLKAERIDYFIFGHRHLPLDLPIEGSSSRYINLGEWVTGKCHFATFDGANLTLDRFEDELPLEGKE